MSSKTKKRAVLPSRPAPPNVNQILEDINTAFPNDPVFFILSQTGQGSAHGAADSEVETKYQQGRRYLELNERLQEVRGRLAQQREELQAAGEQLQQTVSEVKAQAL